MGMNPASALRYRADAGTGRRSSKAPEGAEVIHTQNGQTDIELRQPLFYIEHFISKIFPISCNEMPFLHDYTSEPLCYKIVDRKNGGDFLEDQCIIGLYFKRSERAIEETEKNTAATATELPTIFSPTGRIHRSVSTIPILRPGKPFLPEGPIF